MKVDSNRVRRQAGDLVDSTRLGVPVVSSDNIMGAPGNNSLPPFYQQDHEHGPDNHQPHHHHHETEIEVIIEPCDNKDKCDRPKVCADPVSEVYQKCGNKCVLGCRYASLTSGITLSKHDCEKNDCVEGCFCKTGLVRHQSKCIPASECPIRKCQKNEVYVSVKILPCRWHFVRCF